MYGSKVVDPVLHGVTEAATSTDDGLSKGFLSFALLLVFFRKGRWFPMLAKFRHSSESGRDD